MKFCRNFADILENVENFSEIFEFSSENSWILKEFWPNSDVKSSNGSIPRRSNLSTQVFTVCFMGGNHPVFAETFRFTLPYVSNETKVAIHVIATKGSNAEICVYSNSELEGVF